MQQRAPIEASTQTKSFFQGPPISTHPHSTQTATPDDHAQENFSRKQFPMQVVRGHAAVRALAPLVAKIAEQSGQGHDGIDLAYFLSITKGPKKTPCLLLSRGVTQSPNEPSADGYCGAVFLYEYRYAGVGARVFASWDPTGRRNVFAPPAARPALAAHAARTLVEHGAHLVHLAYLVNNDMNESAGCVGVIDDVAESSDTTDKPFHPAASVEAIESALARSSSAASLGHWTLLESSVPLYLPLGATFDQTVARLGKKTRANLRYYRRLAEREQGCVFVPEVQIGLAEFIAFNRECGYAHTVPNSLAAWRWRSLAQVANPVFCGVRDGRGRWASLIGGRRNGTEMELDWQMNRTDLSRYSLSSAARSWLIDHEIRRGSSCFSVEGGSLHLMMRSFVHGRVAKLTVKRNSFYIRLLGRLAPYILPEDNQVRRIMSDTSLQWRTW